MKDALEVGGVYQSSNVDAGGPPPFTSYVFYVTKLCSFDERELDDEDTIGPGVRAQILVLEGDNRLYPTASLQIISPAYWIWSAAWRIA